MIEADNSYGSLEQIRQRKLKVKGEIHAQEDKMRKLWDSVFHSTPDTLASTPSKRISSLISTAVGLLDGVILGFKLYRRFKKLFCDRNSITITYCGGYFFVRMFDKHILHKGTHTGADKFQHSFFPCP